MQTLGIDFGEAKIGVAIGTSQLAEPYMVIRFKNISEIFPKLEKIIKDNNIEKIIVGVSEGATAERTKGFSASLSSNFKIPVELFDETLTTYDAQKLAILGGIKRVRRKRLEDAFAAAIMLQSYLDTNV